MAMEDRARWLAVLWLWGDVVQAGKWRMMWPTCRHCPHLGSCLDIHWGMAGLPQRPLLQGGTMQMPSQDLALLPGTGHRKHLLVFFPLWWLLIWLTPKLGQPLWWVSFHAGVSCSPTPEPRSCSDTGPLCNSDSGCWARAVRQCGKRPATQNYHVGNAWVIQTADQRWWRGGRWQRSTGEAPVQGTVEMDLSPVQRPPGWQRDFGVRSMLTLTLAVCKISFFYSVCCVINDHFMLLSCACPLCRVSLRLVKDSQRNWHEREDIKSFELKFTCVHLPSPNFAMLVG